MKFSKEEPLPVAAEKLCVAIDHADFPHLRALISREISSSTTEKPITSVQQQRSQFHRTGRSF